MTTLDLLFAVRRMIVALGLSTGQAAWLFAVVAHRNDGDDTIRVPTSQLMASTGMSRSGVRAVASQLAKLGIVRVVAGGGRSVNAYALDLTRPLSDPLTQKPAPVQSEARTGPVSGPSADLSADLFCGRTGRAPSAPPPPTPKATKYHPKSGEIAGLFRRVYAEAQLRLLDAGLISASSALAKVIDGDLALAEQIIRAGVAAGLREPRAIASQPTRFLNGSTRPTSGPARSAPRQQAWTGAEGKAT